MVNDPNITSTSGKVYFPMARVLWGDGGWKDPSVVPTNGPLPWLLSIQVMRNGWNTAATFTCTFALFGDPNYSYTFWGNLSRMTVSVEVAFDEATPQGRVQYRDWTPLIRGFVMNIKQDVVKGIVKITGTDLGGTFNARHHIVSDQEQTVTDSIQAMCTEAKIQCEIDGHFNVTYGNQYKDEKTHQTLGMSSREINSRDQIVKLADDFGATHYIDPQGVYHFLWQPVGATWTINAPTPNFLTGAARHNPSNFVSLTFEHDLMKADGTPTAKGVLIDTQKKSGATITVPENNDDDALPILMDVSQHSPEDALLHMSSHLAAAMGKEWMFDMVTADPTWVDFDVTDVITVQGTNSDNDGPYRCDSIEYSLDAKRGFSVNVKGTIGKDAPGGGDISEGGGGLGNPTAGGGT
jgi:hypothetical protein